MAQWEGAQVRHEVGFFVCLVEMGPTGRHLEFFLRCGPCGRHLEFDKKKCWCLFESYAGCQFFSEVFFFFLEPVPGREWEVGGTEKDQGGVAWGVG